MCGIFGIYYSCTDNSPSEDTLKLSAQRMSHRGPDAQGVFSGEGIGLAHARLSLVDLNPRSNQPFWDESRRYVLVYNGEVYNFRELRGELEQQGVNFHTSSDTEVVLQCLIHYGEQALQRFGGMFALGFYDTQEHRLLLARDRFGMKPLHFFENDQFLLFASEIKALQPWIELESDPFSVTSYLLGAPPSTKGFTFYRGLRTLAPGEYAILQRGQPLKLKRFFQIPDFWDESLIEELDRLNPKQMVDHMEELLWNSVEQHMFADSKVGAFCSGGVDSSLLMAMAAKMHNNLEIFHSNVLGPWSEYHAAKQLSDHLKLDLNVVEVKEQDFVDYMPDAMNQYEHPYTYHPNCVPFMLVSRLVKSHGVKGMLSGEGSDELFLGYPWLGREKIINAYYSAGRRLRSLVHRIPAVGKLIWPHEGNSKQIVRDMLSRREIADDELLTRKVRDAVGHDAISYENQLTVDYMGYHLRSLLHRNDSLGMEASIEARFPFLDHNVVRAAVNMPSRYKLRFSPWVFEKAHPFVRDKWVVREVADRYIPKSLSQRIKIGFWTTTFQRMQVNAEYFDNSYVRDLFELTTAQMRETLAGADQDLTMRLLHLDVWAQVCLRREPTDSVRNKLQQHVTIRPDRGLLRFQGKGKSADNQSLCTDTTK